MKLTKNTKLALIVVGLLVYAAGGYFFLVSKQSAKAGEIATQLADTETKIVEARTASRNVVKVDPVHVADLFRLSKAMPDTTDMPGVLLELNEVARNSGIVFDSITPQPPMPIEGYSIVPIDLVFEGNFYDLADFLYRSRTLVGVRDGALDARGRLFNVQTLDFAEGPDHFPQIRAQLRVEAYVYGMSTVGAVPGAPAPAPATTAPPATDSSTPPASTDAAVPPPAPSDTSATAMGATG